MSEERLGGDLARLLDEERIPMPVPDGARDRIASRLGLTVGAIAASAAAASTAHAAANVSATVAKSTLASKLAIAAVAFTVGATSTFVAQHATEAPPPSPSKLIVREVRIEVPVAVPAPVPAVVPTIGDPAPRPVATTRRHPEPTPLPTEEDLVLDTQLLSPTSTLADESRLLDLARRALGRGDLAAAQSWLDAHARDIEAPMLAEERDALRVRLLARRGDREGARVALDAFVARYPSSVLRATLEAQLP